MQAFDSSANLRTQAAAIIHTRLPPYPSHRRYLTALRRLADRKVIEFYNLRIEARLEPWPSQLFKRTYLIAWAAPTAIEYLAPGKDAFTIPVPTPFGSDIPIVIAPSRRGRNYSEEFRSIIEHELVHVNQVLTDLRVPAYHAIAPSAVVVAYYQDLQIEHEAYLVQSAFWPKVHRAPSGFSSSEWRLVLSHTPALERALATMRDAKVTQALLEGVPRRAKIQLSALGYDTAAISTFTEQWPADVLRAYYHLANRGVPIDTSVSAVVLRWRTQQLGVTPSQ